MASLGKGYTFSATEEVTAAKLHTLIDSGSISGIVAADISDGVITDAKMSSVGGNKFTNLNIIPSGAGVIPAANLTSVAQKGANSDITSLSGLTTLLSRAQGGLASNVANNAANGVVFLDGSSQLPAVSGALLTGISDKQFFTSSDTFTTPTGISTVFVTMVAGGGGGGGDCTYGGGGGLAIIKRPVAVTAGVGYAVTVGAGGAGGAGSGSEGAKNGLVGTDSVFVGASETITADHGNGGLTGTTYGGGRDATHANPDNDAESATVGPMGYMGGNGGANVSFTQGGSGGGTMFGVGGLGSSTGAGAVGSGYGSGGGAGVADYAGAAGKAGFVLVEW